MKNTDIKIGDTVCSLDVANPLGKVLAITHPEAENPIYVVYGKGRSWHYVFRDEIRKATS